MLSLLGGPGRSAASSSRTARSVQQKHSRQKKDPELARWELESQFLQDICKECLDNGVIITRAKYNVDQEFRLPAPSLKIIVPADLSRRDIEAAAKVVKNAAVKVVQAWAKARR
ncbi:hypothetical protein BC828DRAFT_404753 [Blastocladiella britannica]|nr:hypothetical protein BC828DRAFT_404753 [Blastocladiella britannica]